MYLEETRKLLLTVGKDRVVKVFFMPLHRKFVICFNGVRLPVFTSVCSKLNPFPNKPWFLRVSSTRLLKTLWEKEKLLVTSNFSFSRSVFYPFGELSTIFIRFEVVLCKLSVWKSIKFVLRERVNIET